jgi:hypothetical protein
MAGQYDLDVHFGSALHYSIEVIHLEPEQHTTPVGSVGAIADGAVMMFDVKAVQLQDEPAILYQLLILPAAVSPAAVQQALIPAAAGFDNLTELLLWRPDITKLQKQQGKVPLVSGALRHPRICPAELPRVRSRT